MNTNTNKKQPIYYINGKEVYASEFEKNEFPVSIFPDVISDLIQELKDYEGFPVEFSSGSILVAFATAIGTNTQLKFKEKFTVMANIYCMLCGNPGSSKTHPIKALFEPIWEKQKMYYEDYLKQMEQYSFFESTSKQNKEPLSGNTKPKPRLITLDNFTLEILLLRLSENPCGITVVVDELLSFFDNMNRYNSSGSDSETYNSLWSNYPLRVDRKTTDSFYIPPTAVSIFGTIQPAVLENVFSKGKDKNGLAARFLFIMPEGLLPVKWSNIDTSHDLYKKYSQAIHKLLDAEHHIDENGILIPNFLKFTKEASERIIKWQSSEDEYFGESLIEMGSSYYEAFRKLDTYALRFALILHMIYVSVENENLNGIGIRAVENAILLVSYFKKEVIKVHNLLYKKDIRLDMSEKQREVYEILPPDFSISQMYDTVAKLGFSRDQLKKFTGIPKYFTRIAHGVYRKNFIDLSDN